MGNIYGCVSTSWPCGFQPINIDGHISVDVRSWCDLCRLIVSLILCQQVTINENKMHTRRVLWPSRGKISSDKSRRAWFMQVLAFRFGFLWGAEFRQCPSNELLNDITFIYFCNSTRCLYVSQSLPHTHISFALFLTSDDHFVVTWKCIPPLLVEASCLHMHLQSPNWKKYSMCYCPIPDLDHVWMLSVPKTSPPPFRFLSQRLSK